MRTKKGRGRGWGFDEPKRHRGCVWSRLIDRGELRAADLRSRGLEVHLQVTCPAAHDAAARRLPTLQPRPSRAAYRLHYGSVSARWEPALCACPRAAGHLLPRG